jgi:hypothetical protein
LFVKEGIGNGEQGTGGFRWGFIPKREEGTGKRKQEKLFAVPYSLFAYLMKHTTYGSGGLLLPDREQEIGKTVRCCLFPVPFFDELSLPFDRISLEMVYRGQNHFTVAYDKGKATDPIKYFADPSNQDLGVVKPLGKPVENLDLSPLTLPLNAFKFFT